MVKQPEAGFSQPKTVDLKKERKSFATLSQADLVKFEEIVGKENVLIDADEI